MRVSVYCPCCGAAGIKRKLMEVDTAAKGTIYPYCKACKRNIEIHLPLKKIKCQVPCAKCQLNLNGLAGIFVFAQRRTAWKDILLTSCRTRVCTADGLVTTNEQEVTADNVVKVLSTALATHDRNRGEIQYLWDVYRGKQDIRKKEKIVREEINNKITVNIANEIVTFKTAFLLSGPVQYIGAKGSKTDNNKLVDLNRWMSDEDKQSKDKEIVDWMHIAGLGVRMVLPDPRTEQEGSPACIYTLDPREAFVIYYSGYTKKPMAGVLTQYDENDAKYYGVYTESEYFEIKSGKITRQSGHLYGSVPIVESPTQRQNGRV